MSMIRGQALAAIFVLSTWATVGCAVAAALGSLMADKLKVRR